MYVHIRVDFWRMGTWEKGRPWDPWGPAAKSSNPRECAHILCSVDATFHLGERACPFDRMRLSIFVNASFFCVFLYLYIHILIVLYLYIYIYICINICIFPLFLYFSHFHFPHFPFFDFHTFVI